MRIHELVNTKSLNPEFKDQRQVGDILLKAHGGSTGRLHVRAFDVSDPSNPVEAGFADFAIRTNAQGEDYLRAYYTFVNKSYRGKGIAKQIYLFVNDIGNDIMPSELQTDLGKKMWRGLSKSIRQPNGQPAPKPEPTRLDKFKKFFSGFGK